MISNTSIKFSVAFSALLLAALTLSLLISQSAEGSSQSTGIQYAGGEGDENSIGTASDAEGSPVGDCDSPSNCAEVGVAEDEGEYDTYGFDTLVTCGAEVLGVEVTVAGTPGTNDSPEVTLLDGNGDPIGTAKDLSTPGSYSSQTVGGSTDLWGLSANALDDEVGEADFGVEITDVGGSGGGFQLDAIGITIHYDDDWDNDGVCNSDDNCPNTANTDQFNADATLAANGARMGPTPVGTATLAPLVGDDEGDACDDDADNDGFSNDLEEHLRTNPLDNCYGGPTPLSTPDSGDYSDLELNDAWPADISADTHVDEDDFDTYPGNFNLPVDTVLRRRLDVKYDANDIINVQDIVAIIVAAPAGWDCE